MTESPKGPLQDHLTEQRQLLLDTLTSEQHYHETPTLVYRRHNPLEVALATCDTCFAGGNLQRILKGKSLPRWQVICDGCGKKGSDVVRDRCTASLLWNGVNLQTQRYSDLPLFGLAGLTPRDAHIRIRHIRANLVLRIALCDIESQMHKAGISGNKPGTAYRQRLDAYLKWAMLAHRLIKSARGTNCPIVKAVELSAIE